MPKQKTIAPPIEVIKKANSDVKTVSQIGGNCSIQHNIKTRQFLLQQNKILHFVIFIYASPKNTHNRQNLIITFCNIYYLSSKAKQN